MSSTNNQFIKVYTCLGEAGLNPVSILILSTIASYCEAGQTYYGGYASLGEVWGIGRLTVMRHVHQLIDTKYLRATNNTRSQTLVLSLGPAAYAILGVPDPDKGKDIEHIIESFNNGSCQPEAKQEPEIETELEPEVKPEIEQEPKIIEFIQPDPIRAEPEQQSQFTDEQIAEIILDRDFWTKHSNSYVR